MSSDEIFEKFTRRWATDFRKLARMTQGEKDVGDLVSDAWLLSFEIATKRGLSFDFSCLQDQHLLMRWLNFEVNKKADLAYRFAERPDGNVDELGLWNVLEADASADPFERLAADQATAFVDELRATSYSEYTAYCVSWQNAGHELTYLAKHMVITNNTLVKRFRRAGSAKQHQMSLFDHLEKIAEDFLPIPKQSNPRTSAIRADQEQYQLPTLTELAQADKAVTIG